MYIDIRISETIPQARQFNLNCHGNSVHYCFKYLAVRALLGLRLGTQHFFFYYKTKLDRFCAPENPYIPNFIEIVGAVSAVPKIYLYTKIARLKVYVA